MELSVRMFLKNIKIRNFKNLKKLDVEIHDQLNYIYSPNGTGKTNLLEAIQVVTIGKSLRSGSQTDVTPLTKPEITTKITGEFADEDKLISKQSFELINTPKRQRLLKINNNPSTTANFLGRVPSIWFSPENIKIINSSPLQKRKYFDDVLIQLYPKYHLHLRNYNRCLKQRNKVLQDKNPNRTQIRVWTEQLIDYGSKLLEDRKRFFQEINEEFNNLEDFPRYKFQIEYEPNIQTSEIFEEDVEYKFRTILQSTYQKDLFNQSTTAGPHKDTWNLLIQILPNKEFIRADKFASRGQQRVSLIMLQMVLIKIFTKVRETKPIMLLDDIFSELDEENENLLLDFISHHKIQCFITGVNKLKKKKSKIKQINLSEIL